MRRRTIQSAGGVRRRFTPLGSGWYPYYLGHRTVFQRDVSAMPLASNSSAITAKMVELASLGMQRFGRAATFNSDTYSVPLYIIDSRTIKPAYVHFVNADGSDKWINATMRQYLQNNVPLPDDIIVPSGSDKSVTIYDIATNTYRGYWQLQRVDAQSWTTQWGGYLTDIYSLGGTPVHFDMQYGDAGKLSACGLVSNLMDITMEDIDRGEINHALNILLPISYSPGGVSWPAKGTDGQVVDANLPMQGQWWRLNPDFDVDAQGYNRILTNICKALQTYGGTTVDRTGDGFPAIYFSTASTLVERYRTGSNTVRTWEQVVAQYAPGYSLSTCLKDFPAHQLQFAPVDWGKP